jgi:putative ABC transport system permease protein
MSALWRWFIARRLLAERSRTLLTVLGVALGVGVLVSVRLANRSAFASFSDTVDAVTGRANLQVAGTSEGFDERWFPFVLRAPDVDAAAPVVEAWVPARPGRRPPPRPDAPRGGWDETVLLLGVDPFREAPFARTAGPSDARAAAALAALLEPGAAAVPRAFAARHRLHAGDPLPILCSGRAETLRVRVMLATEALQQAYGGNVVIVDIATAQEALDRTGVIDRIDLRVDPERRDRVRAWLARRLPPGLTADLPRGRTRQIEELVAAFALNLTALSFVALFVAVFLIFNAVGLSVLRRRAELGMLRALGVTRAGIAALFLGEGAAIGLAGGLAGVGVGWLFARATLKAVSRTLTDLYLVRQAGSVRLDAGTVALGVALGGMAATLAALAPAIEAARTPPARAMREGAFVAPGRSALRRWTSGSLILLLAAAGVAWWTVGQHRPMGGFVSAFLALCGCAALSPAAVRAGEWLLGPPLARFGGITAVLGIRYLGAALLRSSVVVAAIAVSVGMTVALTLMVGSFRRTVDTWVTQTIRGDLYVEPVGHRDLGAATRLPGAFVAAVRALPGVRDVDSYRGTRLQVDGRLAWAAGVEFAVQARLDHLQFLPVAGRAPRARDVLARALASDGCVVTESFAHRHHVAAGDTLTLDVPAGRARLPVAGVFYDYSTDAGAVFVDRALYARLWRDPRTESVALYLAPGADADRVRRAVLAAAGPGLLLQVTPNQALRSRVLRVFDQTFRITWALQAIAVAVAVLGVFGTMTALVLQRARDLGVLRAAGALRAQVRAVVLVESGLLGAIGAALGCALGLVLALLLVHVINRQFFGWTIRFAPDPRVFLQAFAVMVPAALLAGLAPARHAARPVAAEAVREE